MIIRQEVSVKSLVPHYKNSKHRIDWYIKDLNTVIEVHGEQHSKPVSFGGISKDKATNAFLGNRLRDIRKKQALIGEGYAFVEIWYDEDLNEDLLLNKIRRAQNT